MYEWKQALLTPDDNMASAIRVLNKEALRIALVVDEKGRLLGTITDGDIRRALLQHLGLESKVTMVMHTKPTVASIEDSRETILSMMKNKGLLQVPILDARGRVVGLETLHHLIDDIKYDNPVFLMAGGFGKRLRPLTDDIPKPLLKVGNKPILQTIMERAISSGFHNFFISTHYKAEMVRDYFGNGERWGVSIQYIHEKEPLGTAGALGLLPDTLPDLPILMMNGDLLTDVNFEHLLKFHNEQGGVATLCVREYDFQVPYGVIESDGMQVTSIVEKPVHSFFVNAGIYVLEREVPAIIKGRGYLDMPQFFEECIAQGKGVNMYPLHEYWLDIGRVEDYQRAQDEIRDLE